MGAEQRSPLAHVPFSRPVQQESICIPSQSSGHAKQLQPVLSSRGTRSTTAAARGPACFRHVGHLSPCQLA